MDLRTFSLIGMMVLCVGAQEGSSVSCPKCMYLTYELRNITTLYRMLMESMVSSIDLGDPDCATNRAETANCAAPMFPEYMENKCIATTVTLEAVGVTNVLPEGSSVSCPKCMYLTYELRNITTLYRMLMESMVSSIDLGDPDCATNRAETANCAAPMFPEYMENKCIATTVTLEAVGVTNVLPEAEMTITVFMRECVAQWTFEPVRCFSLDELPQADQEDIAQQMQALATLWDHTSISANTCITEHKHIFV